jgi:DnaK suppressor protein
MNKKESEVYKIKLLAEKTQLEEEMASVGTRSPGAKNGWEATTQDMEVDTADENEVADKLEEYEGNASILNKLDDQLSEVKAALDRIEKGTYGICEKCGQPVEKERLLANPSARVSIKHTHK